MQLPNRKIAPVLNPRTGPAKSSSTYPSESAREVVAAVHIPGGWHPMQTAHNETKGSEMADLDDPQQRTSLQCPCNRAYPRCSNQSLSISFCLRSPAKNRGGKRDSTRRTRAKGGEGEARSSLKCDGGFAPSRVAKAGHITLDLVDHLLSCFCNNNNLPIASWLQHSADSTLIK